MNRSCPIPTVLAVAALFALAAPAAADSGKSSSDPNFITHYGDQAMGTIVNITLWTDDEIGAARAAKSVFDEFRRVDKMMSSWEDSSAVSRINAAAGKGSVAVERELFDIFALAQAVSIKSKGAFDITVGAFRGLWKFDQDRDGSVPAAADVAARTKLVNHRWVALNRGRRSVRLRKKNMRVTLGGIAKGYAVDRGVKLLHDAGFVDFILQAGGDLFVSGRRGSRDWQVGIRDPRGARDSVFATAPVRDRTFSTSGDYERSVVHEGRRYHHILDPATGQPVTRSRSVTVMARNALTADAWSTALFVMGHEKGLKLVESMADLEAVFVDGNNGIHISSGLRQRLTIRRKPSPGP